MSGQSLQGLMSLSVSRQPAAAATSEPPNLHAAPSGPGLSGGHGAEALKHQVASGSGSGSASSVSSGCDPVTQFRATRSQHSPENAARERSRVRNLRQAFHSLQAALPSVPPDTKLSKLDVLVLATNYIAHLTRTLDQGVTRADPALPSRPGGYLHPVKKWPMRSLLYCGSVGELLSANHKPPPGPDRTRPLTPPRGADQE